MPQSPLAADTALTPGGAMAPVLRDSNGQLRVTKSISSSLNITAATVVKATAGRIVTVVVTTAGAAGAVYDHATTSGTGAASLIAVIPATVGVYELDFPCANGIVVAPGAAQVVSVSFV